MRKAGTLTFRPFLHSCLPDLPFVFSSFRAFVIRIWAISMNHRRYRGLTCLAAWLLVAVSAHAQAIPETPVGISGHLEQFVIAGPELEVVPHEDRRAPIRLRIVAVSPHGSAFRYDFEFHGLQPGSFDLKDYLRRKDGSALTDVPALPIKVTATLPPGQIEPNPLTLGGSPVTGGYRLLQAVIAAAWIVGLAVIIQYEFLRRKPAPVSAEAIKPKSLADRLKPLVDGAIAGRLSQPELARLERTLIAYWRRRLHLEGAEPEQAIIALRAHAEAGPLLEQLDAWLHRPGTGGSVDPARLLTPYQHLPADALEGTTA
jgi:hypothetical protein